MKNLTGLFAIVILFFASCKDNTAEINRLKGDLQGATDTLKLCQSARSFHLSRIDTLNNLIYENQSEIYQDSVDMNNYLFNHKMAVACIAGGYVSAKVKMDFSTQYPKTIEDLAGWGIVLAFGYYLFNEDEVDEVISKSEAADTKKKQLNSEIETYQNSISEEKSYLADIVDMETTCQNKASTLRQQLEALK